MSTRILSTVFTLGQTIVLEIPPSTTLAQSHSTITTIHNAIASIQTSSLQSITTITTSSTSSDTMTSTVILTSTQAQSTTQATVTITASPTSVINYTEATPKSNPLAILGFVVLIVLILVFVGLFVWLTIRKRARRRAAFRNEAALGLAQEIPAETPGSEQHSGATVSQMARTRELVRDPRIELEGYYAPLQVTANRGS